MENAHTKAYHLDPHHAFKRALPLPLVGSLLSPGSDPEVCSEFFVFLFPIHFPCIPSVSSQIPRMSENIVFLFVIPLKSKGRGLLNKD